MDFIIGRSFNRQLRKLRIPQKIEDAILADFEEMDPERARQYPYYKAIQFKALKKYIKSKYRVFFAYCSECYGKYDDFLNCPFCDENNLERLVLYDIQIRKFDYR